MLKEKHEIGHYRYPYLGHLITDQEAIKRFEAERQEKPVERIEDKVQLVAQGLRTGELKELDYNPFTKEKQIPTESPKHGGTKRGLENTNQTELW